MCRRAPRSSRWAAVQRHWLARTQGGSSSISFPLSARGVTCGQTLTLQVLQSRPGPRATSHHRVGAWPEGWSCGSGAAAGRAGLGCLPGAGPAPAAVLVPALSLNYQLKQGHQRGTTRVPGCLPGSSPPRSGRVTPHKMPSPDLAACPGTAASPHGAGKAGCRYPGVRRRQHWVLLPAGPSQHGWLPPGRCTQEPHRHPGSGSTVALGLVDQSPAGCWGAKPGEAVAEPPSQPGKRLERVSAAAAGHVVGAARSRQRLHHSVTLSVRCRGARGWAQRLTCTLMEAVAVVCSPEPSELKAWISSVYSGTDCSERQCHPQTGSESQTGHAGG